MSSPEGQRTREVWFVNRCASFWGIVLLTVGIVALLSPDVSRYAWPLVAIAGGVWLLFGSFDWYREPPTSGYEESADRR